MMALESGLDALRVMLPAEAQLLTDGRVTPSADAQILLQLGLPRPAPAGFRLVQRHLVLPHLAAPRLVLPRKPRQALASALDLYRPQRSLARSARAALRLLARAGIAGRLPFAELALLVRAGQPLPKTPLWSQLCEQLPEVRHWAASCGTAGPYRKASLRIMDGGGAPLAQVKVGRDGLPAERIHAEVAALGQLMSMQLQSAQIPALLGHGASDGHVWLIQQHLGDGVAGRPSLEQISALSVELMRRTAVVQRFAETAFYRQLDDRLSRLGGSVAHEGFRVGCAPLAEHLMMLGAAHGDLAIYNVMLRDGLLAVFDWETYRSAAPVLLDLFHWLIFEPLLLGASHPIELVTELLNGRTAAHLRSVLAALNAAAGHTAERRQGGPALPSAPLASLLTLYLVDRISQLEVEQQSHPASARARQIERLQIALRHSLVAVSQGC